MGTVPFEDRRGNIIQVEAGADGATPVNPNSNPASQAKAPWQDPRNVWAPPAEEEALPGLFASLRRVQVVEGLQVTAQPEDLLWSLTEDFSMIVPGGTRAMVILEGLETNREYSIDLGGQSVGQVQVLLYVQESSFEGVPPGSALFTEAFNGNSSPDPSTLERWGYLEGAPEYLGLLAQNGIIAVALADVLWFPVGPTITFTSKPA